MTRTYDLVVVGTGVAGGVAARSICKEGKRVAVIDRGPFGGTCPLRGCEPKKVLFDITDALVRADQSRGHGLWGSDHIDWTELMRFKRRFTDPIPEAVEQSMRKAGIELFHGQAKFVDERTLEVNGEQLQGEHIFIGTGAVPRPMDFPGAEHLGTNKDFLELDQLPRRIVFVGGGYISFEFAHVAVRAGAQVDILQRSERCLKHFDADLVAYLCSHSQQIGINVHYNAPAYSVEKTGEGFHVRAGETGELHMDADIVIHGAGRVAAVDAMELERGNVSASSRGIEVNEFMQSVSNPQVYAAGDVTAEGAQLTPVALLEAETAVQNLLHGNTMRVDYSGIPSVLFTHPPLAEVGKKEQQLKDEGIKYKSVLKETDSWASYERIGEKPAAAKLLIEEQTGAILGAHILGHGGPEAINLFALAIRKGLTAEDLKAMVWSYPSFGYDFMRHLL